jgi:plastocyanin
MKFVALAALVAALAVPSASAAIPTLTALVGPGFNISLKQGNKKVTRLKAGTYIIKVTDKSKLHNFHIKGPGVNKKTSVKALGSALWKVTLTKGTYKFLCDPHPLIMKGSFKVT